MSKAQKDKGKVKIANDVVAAIAATAATEIEGVFAMAAYAGGITVFLRKNMTKGVKVTISGEDVILDLNIVIRIGYRIIEISENVQSRVKNAVQNMTGLNVRAVNVVVSGVYLEKDTPSNQPRKGQVKRTAPTKTELPPAQEPSSTEAPPKP